MFIAYLYKTPRLFFPNESLIARGVTKKVETRAVYKKILLFTITIITYRRRLVEDF